VWFLRSAFSEISFYLLARKKKLRGYGIFLYERPNVGDLIVAAINIITDKTW